MHYYVAGINGSGKTSVLARIQKDDKHRALFPPDVSDSKKLDMLDAYQQQTESLFYKLSKHYKLPAFTIQNDGDLSTAAETFINSTLHGNATS